MCESGWLTAAANECRLGLDQICIFPTYFALLLFLKNAPIFALCFTSFTYFALSPAHFSFFNPFCFLFHLFCFLFSVLFN